MINETLYLFHTTYTLTCTLAGILPTYYRAYNSAVPYDERVAQLLAWLRLPDAERPSLLTLYLEITDSVCVRCFFFFFLFSSPSSALFAHSLSRDY